MRETILMKNAASAAESSYSRASVPAFIALLALLMLAILLATSPALSMQPVFERIVDVDDRVPQEVTPGDPEFFSVFGAPALSGGNLVFRARSGDDRALGLYTTIGGSLTRVAKEFSTPVPGGFGDFTRIGRPEISGNRIVFLGESNRFDGRELEGVYLYDFDSQASLEQLAVSTPSRETTGQFSRFGGIWMDQDEIAIAAGGVRDATPPTPSGLFRHANGAFSSIVPVGAPAVSGPQTFLGFGDVELDGTDLAFSANLGLPPVNGVVPGGLQSGIFALSDGSLRRVVDDSAPIPGGVDEVFSLSNVSTSGGEITFSARSAANDWGLHVEKDGAIRRVVGPDSFPTALGRVDFVSSVTIDDGNVAFATVQGNTQSAIYVEFDRILYQVAAPGVELDGKIIARLELRENGFEGRQLAFQAGFTDGTQGIYLATIPEPSTALLLISGLLYLGLRRR